MVWRNKIHGLGWVKPKSMLIVAFIMALCCHLCQAKTISDTIPVHAQQTATRTVEVNWTCQGEATLYRQYPDQENEVALVTTSSGHWIDHQSRAVCGDTVRYTVSAGNDHGHVAISVRDMDPTAMAEWGVVTMDPTLGKVTLEWMASPDTDIMGYLVCEGTPSIAIDTVYGRDNTHYVYNGEDVDVVHHFRICAFDSCRQASPLTDACNNIVLALHSEKCSQDVQIEWNAYMNMPSGIGSYELWCSENEAPFVMRQRITDITQTSTTVTVSDDCIKLRAYIVAVSADGVLQARSGSTEYLFGTDNRPAYLYLRKVSTSDDGKRVTVVGQTDPAFDGTDYKVYRIAHGSNAAVVGHCSPSTDGTLQWCDNGVDAANERYEYYFGVTDGCGRNEIYSGKGATLTPALNMRGVCAELEWNAYEGWDGSTSYQVLASAIGEDIWHQIATTTATSFVDNDANEGARKYKIVAYEAFNSTYHCDDSLQSNVILHRPHTDVWTPNAITPLENSNNYFLPLFSYVDAEGYSLYICNRKGQRLFYSTDPNKGWDGRCGGQLQPSGAYVYKITYRQNDGSEQQIVGTVLLIY